MSGGCSALLINCMDPRLQGANAEAIAKAAGFTPGDWEQLSYPGPSLWLTDPHQAADSQQFWWTFEQVSEKVHLVSKVVLIGHSECGGFRLKHGLLNPTQEKATIVESLRAAADQLKRAKPLLEVSSIFVTIHNHQPDGTLPSITCEVIS